MNRPPLRCRRSWTAVTTAVEFALAGGAFVALLLLTAEVGWQMAIDLALDYGARAASRFGVTGAAMPPGITPPPATRADAIAQLVISTTGGLLLTSRLTMSETSYGAFSSIGNASAATPGPGTAGQVVQYTLSYAQPFITPLAAVVIGNPTLIHHATVVVLNEPFPSS